MRTASGYKPLWNPAPANFAHQTTPNGLASGHRPDAPTGTFIQGSPRRPRRRLAIRIPRATPPGIYLVLVFDGSEGGQHTTWDYVQVPDEPGTRAGGRPPAPASETGAATRPGGPATTIADFAPATIAGFALGAITVFALGAITGALVSGSAPAWRRSRRPRPRGRVRCRDQSFVA